MDYFNDARVRSAEDEHTKRRRRAGLVFDTLNTVFHVAILVFALTVIGKVLFLIGPHLLEKQ